ncbi:MAG: Hint domain-containing protein [Rhodovulum sp.]
MAEGANLRTPCGPRRVASMRPGDMMVTRGNGWQAVRLTWRRRLSAEALRANPALAPIRLKPRALGAMMPRHDLVVAPGHRVLIPGWRLANWSDEAQLLLPAADIAGRSDAAHVDRSCEDVALYQFVFDGPQVLNVNGLPVESLAADAEVIATLVLAEREALLRRFPGLGRDPTAYPPAEYPSVTGVALRATPA